MSNVQPVLCIPRIDNTTTKKYIFDKIRLLDWGIISKIIEIPLKNESDKKRIIINLKWNNKENTNIYKEKLLNNETIKLVHNSNVPFYWRISKFK